jgi:hypothetical protein
VWTSGQRRGFIFFLGPDWIKRGEKSKECMHAYVVRILPIFPLFEVLEVAKKIGILG